MDFWGLNCNVALTNSENRRGLGLNLDLNFPLPPQVSELDLSLGLASYNTNDFEQEITNAATVDFLGDDDEVAIISPRTFAQARENSERNHSLGKRAILQELTAVSRGHSAMTTLCTNCKSRMQGDSMRCLKPETSNKKEINVFTIQQLPGTALLQEESLFSCPVCMGPLTEPTSTRCGHIFCKECLQRSLKSMQNKCPTCRQKVGKRGIFRVYLPTAN